MGTNAWNKDHYYARGFEHGKTASHRDIHDPNTWQWYHYNRGYEAGRAELSFTLDHKEPPKAPNVKEVANAKRSV